MVLVSEEWIFLVFNHRNEFDASLGNRSTGDNAVLAERRVILEFVRKEATDVIIRQISVCKCSCA